MVRKTRGLACLIGAAVWLLAAGVAIGAPGATTTAGVSLGSIERPASGLYVLDRAIGFNVLDAAAIDPKSGRIMLIGHRDKRYGGGQIPYFELLATLLEYPRPRFTMVPTPESSVVWRNFFKGGYDDRIIDAFLSLYSDGEANANALALLGLPASGADKSALTAAVLHRANDERRARELLPTQPDLLRAALLAAWTAPDGLQFGPTVMRSAFNLHVAVGTDYIEVAPDSALASVMLDADYAGKGLLHMRGVDSSVPGYRTEFAFDRSGPLNLGQATTERVWFSVGRLALVKSTDGNTLETRSVSMRVNIRGSEYNPSNPQIDPRSEKPTPYAALLTALYEPLSEKLAPLHALSECAKLAAVARWLHARDSRLALPKGGRTRWRGPESVPGHFYVYLGIPPSHPLTATKLTLEAVCAVDGGVSLDPFPGDSGLPDIHVDPAALDLNKTTLAAPPPISGLPPGMKPFAWVKNVPGQPAYQVAAVTPADTGEDLTAAPGTDTKAFDQLDSVATSSGQAKAAALIETKAHEAMLGFDTAGEPGSAPMVSVRPVQAVPVSAIPDRVKLDPVFKKLYADMTQQQKQIEQVSSQITQVKQQIQSAPPDQIGDLQVREANLKQRNSDLEAQRNFDKVKIYTSFNVNVNVVPDAGSSASSGASEQGGNPP